MFPMVNVIKLFTKERWCIDYMDYNVIMVNPTISLNLNLKKHTWFITVKNYPIVHYLHHLIYQFPNFIPAPHPAPGPAPHPV